MHKRTQNIQFTHSLAFSIKSNLYKMYTLTFPLLTNNESLSIVKIAVFYAHKGFYCRVTSAVVHNIRVDRPNDVITIINPFPAVRLSLNFSPLLNTYIAI